MKFCRVASVATTQVNSGVAAATHQVPQETVLLFLQNASTADNYLEISRHLLNAIDTFRGGATASVITPIGTCELLAETDSGTAAVLTETDETTRVDDDISPALLRRVVW